MRLSLEPACCQQWPGAFRLDPLRRSCLAGVSIQDRRARPRNQNGAARRAAHPSLRRSRQWRTKSSKLVLLGVLDVVFDEIVESLFSLNQHRLLRGQIQFHCLADDLSPGGKVLACDGVGELQRLVPKR